MENITVTIGSLNVLHPYYAVKWYEKPGLNMEGKTRGKEKCKLACETDEWTELHNWVERVPLIKKRICEADIVCLQEVDNVFVEDLQTDGYQLLVSGFGKQTKPFGNAIMCKTSGKLLESSTLIENKADVVSTINIQGKKVKIASVHLDGYYRDEENQEKKDARKLAGFNQLLKDLEIFEENSEDVDLFIIAGDFNEDTREEGKKYCRMDFLRDNGYSNDGYVVGTEPGGQKIDWIFVKPGNNNKITINSMKLENLENISDHSMIGTKIGFN
jgi:endonuclease/exonuclease/phosphatase family metal-dependent hydrolase